MQRLVVALHFQGYTAAAHSPKQLAHARRGEARTRHAHLADAHNLVAGTQASRFGGAAAERRHHRSRIPKQAKLDANAIEVALQESIRRVAVFGRDVDRVRVELFEHALHGKVGQPFGIDGVGVVAIYVAQYLLEAQVAAGRRVRIAGGGPKRVITDQYAGAQRAEQQQDRAPAGQTSLLRGSRLAGRRSRSRRSRLQEPGRKNIRE